MNEFHNFVKDRLFQISKKKEIYLAFAVIIGLVLIAPKDINFAKDRLNYLNYAENSFGIINLRLSKGVISFLSNEPLFLLFNALLGILFAPETIVKIIIFGSTIGVLYSLGKLSNYNLLVLFFFLFVPQILKNHITHLRQGLALSVYLFGLTINNKYGNLIKIFSVFIHTSFAFVILFEILDILFKKIKFNLKWRYFLPIISLSLVVYLIPFVVYMVGDRRYSEYEFTKANGASGLGFMLWVVVGLYFIIKIKKNYKNIICCYGIVFYCISYYFLDFGARIFENILPLILVAAITDEEKEVRVFFIIFFLLYGCIQWYLRGGFNF